MVYFCLSIARLACSRICICFPVRIREVDVEAVVFESQEGINWILTLLDEKLVLELLKFDRVAVFRKQALCV